MRNFNFLLCFTLLLVFSNASFGQFWSETFETDGNGTRYSTSIPEFSDNSYDFFGRIDGSNVGNGYQLEGITGAYFAAMDLDAEENQRDTAELYFNDIDISGKNNIILGLTIAEDDDGTNQDWDADTYLKVLYKIDDATEYTNLLWVAAEGGTNTVPKIDTDFDGLGDGAEITNTFAAFGGLVVGSGEKIHIKIVFEMLDAGDEDIAIDNITLAEASGNIKPVISNWYHMPLGDITSTTTVNVSADVIDDGSVNSVTLKWGTALDALSNELTMSNGGSGNTYTAEIPAQADGTTVYYAITAVDDQAESTTTSSNKYVVRDAQSATLPYTETFDDGFGKFYTYGVSGDTKYWKLTDGYANMNGYNTGDKEVDYLISPAFDFTATDKEVISFKSWRKYGSDNADNYMKLMYSSTYSGLGDPSNATWTELSGVGFATEDDTWTQVDDYDISEVSGSRVHFAFVYSYDVDTYVNWRVDSVVVKENTSTALKSPTSNLTISSSVTREMRIFSEDIFDVSIYSLSGVKVKDARNVKKVLSVSELPKGVYVVSLKSENGQTTVCKILKQ